MIYYDLNLKGSNYQNDYNLIKQANEFGWNYLNLLYSPNDYVNAIEYKDKLINDLQSLDLKNTTEIGMGIYIRDSNPNEIRKIVTKYRNKVDFISVLGGKNEVNRSVLENHHLSAAYRLLQEDEEMNILINLSKDDWR